MFKAYVLPTVTFAFGQNKSADKFRGLQMFGPHREVAVSQPPRFGFVFPSEYRDHANRLYLALKNGVGYFRGVESTFRFLLQKDQVFPVTGFSIPERTKPSEAALIYADNILSWSERANQRPDLFFILHPRTSRWDAETPYYKCKALLLQQGFLSQDVTVELIDNPSSFEWSVANIALAAFVKLGGVPWIVYTGQPEPDQDLIIGIGRANIYDPHTREAKQFIGFTACFSATGEFKFISFANVAQSRQDYLKLLSQVVGSSLSKAERLGKNITSLSLHIPKEISNEEIEIVQEVLEKHNTKNLSQLSMVKITDESLLFAVNERHSDGIPARGTVIQTSEREYLLYTEGHEEKQSWRQRTPTALRVVPQIYNPPGLQHVFESIRHIHGLSQVNWRGFNAHSRPISIYYGRLIADILKHLPMNMVNDLYKEHALKVLEERMWFL
jgi:hypothetical protein